MTRPHVVGNNFPHADVPHAHGMLHAGNVPTSIPQNKGKKHSPGIATKRFWKKIYIPCNIKKNSSIRTNPY